MRATLVGHPGIFAATGHLGTWLEARGFEASLVDRAHVDSVEPDDADLLVTMGSPWTMARRMDEPDDPPEAATTIAAEQELVRARVASGRPLLAICFGAQLLSATLGGTVTRQPTPYVGWITPATELPEVQSPWVVWHNDAFSIPPGADPLAVAAHAPVAFRIDGAWAVQFHPELNADILEGLGVALEAPPSVSGPLAAVARQRADANRAEAMAFFDRFWSEVS